MLVLGAAVRGAGLRPSEETHILGLSTESVVLPGSIDLTLLGAWLEADDHGLLRAKGRFKGSDGRRYLLQLVGRRWTITEIADGEDLILVLISDDRDAAVGAAARPRSLAQ